MKQVDGPMIVAGIRTCCTKSVYHHTDMRDWRGVRLNDVRKQWDRRHSEKPDNIISQYGNRIIKISDDQVVKWGPDVTKEEAENQRIAYELVDNRIVHIPRVYAFFSDEQGWGYIVMEYIEGKVIDPLEDINAIEKVAGVLDYFATLRHDIPGPLSGGICRGLLFPETEDLVFDTEPKIQILPKHYQEIQSIVFLHQPIQCQIIRQAGMSKLSGKALPRQDPLLALLYAPLEEPENKIEFTIASLVICAQFGLRTLNHLMLRKFG
ncbi:hypothetical protein PENSUB_5173 [Penicillium subrubescens]|uniref:Aminoglycoside phosphotransferase domain-containing protein n=1 Tax=Penicillium subrubescens TaxID=1316194 RepID=A0A1Q5UAI7_9EURO|nr:hypothetical protein PENSUB_5173 [Penicillium subrubescens]